MDSAWAGLIGAGIGATASVGAGVVTHFLSLKKEREGLQSAVAGEVRAILDLIAINEYEGFIANMIKQLERGEMVGFGALITRSYTKVYAANIERLGLLGKNASAVVAFYMLIDGALEDKDAISLLAARYPTLATESLVTREHVRSQSLSLHQSLLKKLTLARAHGEAAIRSLNYGAGLPGF